MAVLWRLLAVTFASVSALNGPGKRSPPRGAAFRATRRAVCFGASALLCAPWECALAAPPDTERARAVLGAFEQLSRSWEDATTDCRFGEVKRELLSAGQKTQLLEEASSFATFNKEKTMNVLCKRSTALARALIDGPSVQRVEGDLRKLIVRVPEDMGDEYLALIDGTEPGPAQSCPFARLPWPFTSARLPCARPLLGARCASGWSQSRSAASVAAFTSASGDMASINSFAKGSDDGGSENLRQAQLSVAEAARVLRRALELVDAEPPR